MMPPNDAPAYCPVSEYLQQGDIFKVRIVTPFSDRRERLFRTVDGRHGSLVFSSKVAGTVFERSDLELCLKRATARDPWHTDPFQTSPDGQEELVVTFAKIVEFFVTVTQTCDISGQDKHATSHAIILPVKTLSDLCRFDRVPFKGRTEPASMEEYLAEVSGTDALKRTSDAFEYGKIFRRLLDEWNPDYEPQKENRSRIKNFLKKALNGGGYVYYLRADEAFEIPEMCVDFSAAYTVHFKQLREMAECRIARIADPYRDHFARAFADRLSRIALPKPMGL